ncbi:MAG TPA: carboxypeptidase regulatory-like domain-containing protein, partial [Candidatus Eremiobacteraceae bacterium]|nr:carboxypeptidase regulatory-like domain-containing protein [Candidatus Eremiobacteraceae bacterium]
MDRICRALCAISFVCIACAATWFIANAAAATALRGTVTANGKPVASAEVSAAGNNITERTRTDSRGRFDFLNVMPGTYVVTVVAQEGTATTSIDLPASGADVTIALGPKQLGVVAITAAAPPLRKSGTDVTLDRVLLTRSPAAGSFPELLVQLPGAARGANGVVHINGDHGDINYVVDGVAIPQELNRNIGTEFNSNDVSFMDVIEGAYPAQYGERFASVLNINTRAVNGASGLSGALDGGTFGMLDTTLAFDGTLGAGALAAAVRNSATQRGLDPPNLDSPHNDASDANQFVRYTVPHGNDYLNVTFSHAYQTYQLPVDVLSGEPARTDDNETQDDLFAALEERRALGSRGSLSYGLGWKHSHIGDFGDPPNDWTFGENLNLAAGGSAADCSNALSSGNFSPTTCAYSLAGDRTAVDYKFNLDETRASGDHTIGWGGIFGITHVSKLYQVALQPNNFLAPLVTPAMPNAPYAVVDNAPNNGDSEALYLQDAWRPSASYELDYGARADSFQLRSAEFERGFSQVSPRIKLTRILGTRSSVYAYYGRFFTPFSFENVSPHAAQTLNMPLQRQVAAFDLKPQRDSDYELGGHLPLGGADLGVRIMQKNATDLIDDTQVGVTLLHQDINYQRGRIATQSLYYQLPLQRHGRFSFTLNHTYSVNKGCETQLLAPCFGSPTDWTPADHEQRWGSTVGEVLNDRRGGWLSIAGEYGSGLSSAACPPGTPGFCKYTPHTTFDIERGIALGPQAKLTMRIRNLLNDKYRITYLNAQGNHWYA